MIELSSRIKTQDNRCTAYPIFQVRGLRRIYGIDTDFTDYTVWLDEEGDEIEGPVDEENPPEGVVKIGYMETWQVIQEFFSEESALEFQARNAHRHSHYVRTDVYVDSLYRNPEMIAVRDHLISLSDTTDKTIDLAPMAELLSMCEGALADIAEGEHDLTSADALRWAEERAVNALSTLRQAMKGLGIKTTEWPPLPN